MNAATDYSLLGKEKLCLLRCFLLPSWHKKAYLISSYYYYPVKSFNLGKFRSFRNHIRVYINIKVHDLCTIQQVPVSPKGVQKLHLIWSQAYKSLVVCCPFFSFSSSTSIYARRCPHRNNMNFLRVHASNIKSSVLETIAFLTHFQLWKRAWSTTCSLGSVYGKIRYEALFRK